MANSMTYLFICLFLMICTYYCNYNLGNTISRNNLSDLNLVPNLAHHECEDEKSNNSKKANVTRLSKDKWDTAAVDCVMTMSVEQMQDLKVSDELKHKMNLLKSNPTESIKKEFKDWTKHKQFIPVQVLKGDRFPNSECAVYWQNQERQQNKINTGICTRIETELSEEVELHRFVWSGALHIFTGILYAVLGLMSALCMIQMINEITMDSLLERREQ